MARERLITTAGSALIAAALAGTDNLAGLTVVLGSGRTSPADGDAGVETPLAPVRSFASDYAAVSSNGIFQSGISDNTVNDESGMGGTDYTASELAVMKGAICVARAVETDTTLNLLVKPPNASYSLNLALDVDNPTSGTVTVNITNFDGLGDVGIPGRVPFNTDDQFANRTPGLWVPKTSQIPAPATAPQVLARTGEGYVPANLLPSSTFGIEFIPAANVSGSNLINIQSPSDASRALAAGLAIRWVAEATSTNRVYIDYNGHGSRELHIDGVQASSNDIVQAKLYDAFYDGSRWRVIGSDTEYLDHSHFIAPVVISAGASSINWNAAAAPIAHLTLPGNRTLNGFTNGMDGGFYELVVTASGGTRNLVLATTYERGNTAFPSPIENGDTSLLMFQRISGTRLFVGERTGYDL